MYKIMLDVYKASPKDPNCLEVKYEQAVKNVIHKLNRKTDQQTNVSTFTVEWTLS